MIWLLVLVWMLAGLVTWFAHLGWLSMWMAFRAVYSRNCKTIPETRRFLRKAGIYVLLTLLVCLIAGPLSHPLYLLVLRYA